MSGRNSHALTFVPAAFATRPVPPFPQRTQYASFDPAGLTQLASAYNDDMDFLTGNPQGIRMRNPPPPASPPANIAPTTPSSAPPERLGAGWPSPPVDAQRRHFSIPPALDAGSFATREREPYPARTVDEITNWMPPPIVEPRRYASNAITEEEIRVARPYNLRNDWHRYPEENNPRHTPWAGHDRGYFGLFGSPEAPNETAAVPNDEVMESVEPEHDSLIALRQARDQNQAMIQRELNTRVELEDSNRELERRLGTLGRDYMALEETQDRTVNTLNEIERERDQGQEQIERLALELRMPEEELRQRQAQQVAYERARLREVELAEQVRVLRQSETGLANQLQAQTARADRLEESLRDAVYDRDGFRDSSRHWEQATNRERAENQNLEGQLQTLRNQLAAAQAPANPHNAIQPAVNGAPNIIAPVAVQAPVAAVAAHPVGPIRGGRRARARGGAGAAPVVRNQPGRLCKTRKSYKT